MSEYGVQICSTFYIILLIIVFFSKKRIDSPENKVFKYIILLNLIGQILEIGCIFFVKYMDKFYLLRNIFTKCYLLYLITWIFTFTLYIIIITYKNILEKTNIKYLILLAVPYFICAISSVLLPMEYNNINGKIYSYGLGPKFAYIISFFLIIIWIFILLLNFKSIKQKKYYPIFSFIIGGVVIAAIQSKNPEFLLITSMETFVCYLMYFTIENPDMKMINELNIAKDQAVKANQAKSDFLSSMSHEIRTPLNAIVGFSESLKDENLNTESMEEVNDIIDASNTLLEIVNGILDISKIEANKIEIVNTEYNFKKIFNELVALSKARLGDTKPIEFRYHMNEDIPGTLYGDYARVKQITLNLLTNAIKYTDKGYIDFTVSSIINGDIARLIISVEDSGRGIKKESINKLFTKFERLDEKNTTIEGTGLGLAITKKLTELMGGKIIVQSIYGKGSKFTAIIDQRIIAMSSNEVEDTEKENTKKLDLHKKKILVVDDNSLNLKVASRLLRDYEAQIELVDSGFKCIDLIASGNDYDLILMDDMMPKLSGTDTLHRLRENAAFNIPVVALTANAISGMREKYLSEGFNDYLAKPIEKNELKEILYKYLG